MTEPSLEEFRVTLTHPEVGTFDVLGSIFTSAKGQRYRSPGLRFADPVPDGPFPHGFEGWLDHAVTEALQNG